MTRKILRERILAMKEIWTKDEAEYRGQFVNFDPIWSWPKPAEEVLPAIKHYAERGEGAVGVAR